MRCGILTVGALAHFARNIRAVQPRIQKLPLCDGRVYWSVGFLLEPDGRMKFLLVCEQGRPAAFQPGNAYPTQLETDGVVYPVDIINTSALWMNMEERFNGLPFQLAAVLSKVPEIPEELRGMSLHGLSVCEIVLAGAVYALPAGTAEVILSDGKRWTLTV